MQALVLVPLPHANAVMGGNRICVRKYTGTLSTYVPSGACVVRPARGKLQNTAYDEMRDRGPRRRAF